jgi:hypothetical protein
MQRKVKISELVISEELTAMRPINSFMVSRYRQAYRAGNDLGMPIVDAKTNIIVSGNHRVTAMLEEFGEDHEITVEMRKFASKADILKTFAAENVRHGMPLDGRSRIALICAMAHEGVPVQEVAQIIGISIKRTEELAGMTMVVRGRNKAHCERVVPCKHGAEHKAGQTITKAEAERHAKHDRGITALSMCKQLTAWLRDGWIDTEDAATMDAIDELAEAMNDWMATHAATAGANELCDKRHPAQPGAPA